MSSKKVQEDIAESGPSDDDVPALPDQSMDMIDVIRRVTEVIGDPRTVCGHIAAGTMNDYLDASLDSIVLDMAIIPVARALNDLDADDDAASVTAGFRQIATIFASLFNKDQRSMEQSLISKMNSFPIDDVRESYSRRVQGALH